MRTTLVSKSLGSRPPRRGALVHEIVVAFTLLSTAMAVAIPGFIRLQRVLRWLEHDQIALHELDQSLQKLSQLSPSDWQAVIAQWKPSPSVARHLDDACLQGTITQHDAAYHITLTLAWRDPGRQRDPMSLATWLIPSAATTESIPGGTP